MSNEYPEPPRSEWADFALLSEAADPEEYRDIWGAVQDDENWRQLTEQVIVPFATYSDIPTPGPFDGAKAEALDSNVVVRWDETAGDWIALNTGTSENAVPGTSHYESVKADQTTIGDASPVTGGPVGDANEWVPVGSLSSGAVDVDVTATTWTTITGGANSPTSHLNGLNLTNIDEFGATIAIRQINTAPGETARFRANIDGVGVASVDFTDENAFNVNSAEKIGVDSFTLPQFPQAVDFEAEVSAGTATYQGVPSIQFWGRVK